MSHVQKTNCFDWRPTASFDNLKKRTSIIQKIRRFFADRQVLEVDTPLLSQASNTDLHLAIMTTQYYAHNITDQAQTLYLQTSPEFAMKRLLAAGSGDIYQIAKAFRNGESGHQHNPEFTMLEWYRIGYNHHQLMDEMDELLHYILQTKPAQRLSYQQLFEQYLQINPHKTSIEQLKICADKNNLAINSKMSSIDDWLTILLTHCIEPQLGFDAPCFIYDYPTSQAALAKVNNNVAERFEVYINGIELANGFHELTSVDEQKKRFNDDLKQRKKLNYSSVKTDQHLLSALQHGLPDCAGVALGIDRLIMLAINANSIDQTMTFSLNNA